MSGVKDCVVIVTGNKQTFVDNLSVNSLAPSYVLMTGGMPQKKGVNPNIVQQKLLKYLTKNASCVHHLSSIYTVTKVPIVAPDLPAGARLHQFGKK